MNKTMFKTRDGGDAIIFGNNVNEKRCYIGAYYTGEKWLPTDWCADGRWHNDLGHPRGLDLMFDNNKKNETSVSES